MEAVAALVVARKTGDSVQFLRRYADGPQLPDLSLAIPGRRAADLRVASLGSLTPDDGPPLLRLMKRAAQVFPVRDVIVIQKELPLPCGNVEV